MGGGAGGLICGAAGRGACHPPSRRRAWACCLRALLRPRSTPPRPTGGAGEDAVRAGSQEGCARQPAALMSTFPAAAAHPLPLATLQPAPALHRAPPWPTRPPAGEAEALDGELKETQAALAELQVGDLPLPPVAPAPLHPHKPPAHPAAAAAEHPPPQAERDELAGQLGGSEAELQNVNDNLEHARCVAWGGAGGWVGGRACSVAAAGAGAMQPPAELKAPCGDCRVHAHLHTIPPCLPHLPAPPHPALQV